MFCSVLLISALVGAPGGKDTKQVSTVEQLRTALDQPVSLESNELPLHTVIAQLSEIAKVPIVVDRSVLQQMGIDPVETVVSLRAKEMKLKTALRTVAGQHGLSFAIVGDHILVSLDDVLSQRQLHQRVAVKYEDLTLAKALQDLTASTAVNLVLDPRVAKKAESTKVTLKLDDVPLETVVRVLAELADLKPVRLGNLLFITNEERAEKLQKDPDDSGAGALMRRMLRD